jgi:hypothetical protein
MASGVLVFAITARSLPAAQSNYGTFMGTNFNYVNVTEDSGADETLTLLGSPTVTGNSIDFNPVGFDAARGTTGSDITVSNLVFMVTAKPGSRIESLTLNAAGNTTLSGNVAPGSFGTATAAFGSGVLDIHEFDFAGINHISVPFSMTFSPSGGTYFLGTDGGGGPAFNTAWTGSVSLPVESILIANGFTIGPGSGATKISIDMQGVLVAVSQSGTSTSIHWTDLGGFAILPGAGSGASEGVPEPAGIALAVAAAVGLAICHRIRRAGCLP